MTWRFYIEAVLMVTIAWQLIQLVIKTQDHIEESYLAWQEDYDISFCAHYFAWRRNLEASLQWIEENGFSRRTLGEAAIIIDYKYKQQRKLWPNDPKELCQPYEARLEVYFQQNPSLTQPYPNWSVRYLEVPRTE